ncbi:S-layer homology domain-containing protein [Candidatus Margulisiibacteriota bacterium]
MNKILRSGLLVLFLASFLCSFSFAILQEAGVNPLDLEVGARPASMGDAYTAVSGDINSIFYNPAALSKNKGFIFSIQNAQNFSIGQALTTNSGTLGFGMVYRGFNDFSYLGSTANYESNAVFLGYSSDLKGLATIPYLGFMDDSYLGINYKYLLNQRLSPKSSAGLASSGTAGTDIGFLFAPEYNWYKVGLSFNNALGGITYQLGATTEVEGGSTDLGIAVNIIGDELDSLFVSDSFKLLMSTDQCVSGKINNKRFLSLGFELSFMQKYSLRFGTQQVPSGGGEASYSSSGLGIKLNPTMNLDLASYQEPVTGNPVSYISLSYMPPVFGWGPVEAAEEVPRGFVKVTYPPKDFITYNDSLKVQGYIRTGADVYINDVMAYVGDNLYFDVEVPLNPGKNLIQIKGKFKGREETVDLKILRKAKVIIAEEEQVDRVLRVEIKGKENELKLKEKLIRERVDKAKNEDEKRRLELEAKKITEERTKLAERKTTLEKKKGKIKERKEKVENLVTLGVIEVSHDKQFEIESKITKGEMVSWLVKAANMPLPEVTGNVCADVPMNYKYAPYIKVVLDAGLMKTDSNNRFYPEQEVTESTGEKLFREFGVIK